MMQKITIAKELIIIVFERDFDKNHNIIGDETKIASNVALVPDK